MKGNSQFKVLLIGGTGTLSFAVLQEALKKCFSVSVFNRGNHNEILPNDVKVLKGNFYDANSIIKSIGNKQYDVIVDFLSRKPADIERVYTILRDRCSQYIFVSSACVYDRQPQNLPICESSPKPNRDWSYNINKFDCETLLNSLSKDVSSYYTIVRPYITYNNRRIPLGIAPRYKYHRTIIERVLNDKPMFIWNPDSLTTITYADEFAVGMVGLFLNKKAYNEAFHITSEYCYKTRDIILELYHQLGKRPNVIEVEKGDLCKYLPNYKSMMVGDRFMDAVFDNKKIKDAVPYLEFKCDLPKGVSKIIDYYNNLSSYDYDYQYDGQIDRLLAKQGCTCKYISYKNTLGNHRLTYYIYRFFPYHIAAKVAKVLKLK